MTASPLDVLRATCADLGISVPSSLEFDGKVHRYHCDLNDKTGVRDAWYRAIDNNDGTYGGTCGHWKLNIKKNWFTGAAKRFTPEERAEFARQRAERDRAEAERLQKQYQRAAKKACRIWEIAKPASSSHGYIAKKAIFPHGAKELNGSLVVDYRDGAGRLTTVQFIREDSTKRFLAGSQVGGSYHRMGLTRPDTVIAIAEGFATAATIHEATGLPCAVCGSSVNIVPVALILRQKFPRLGIIICADRDGHGKGEAAARQAAELVGAAVILPEFPEDDDHE